MKKAGPIIPPMGPASVGSGARLTVAAALLLPSRPQEQPLVDPQVVHFRQVPLRTSVKLPHSPQLSPS